MNEHVQALHQAYCEAMGIDLVLNFVFQRWWFEAHKMGVTPDDVKLCIKARLRNNLNKRELQYRQGVEIKHLARDEESIASMLNEAAVLRAQMRKKSFPPDKASVLKATGRETQPEQGTKLRHVSEVFSEVFKAL